MTKLENLKEIIKNYGKAIIAFSGGIDSTLLLKISLDVLGKENVIAVTGISETYSEQETINAKEIASSFNVEHVLLITKEFENKEFVKNTPDRCYHCKKEFYSKMVEFSKKHNINTIFEGTQCDDIQDYRPGRKVVEELGIISPYLEAGIHKEDIREIARTLKIKQWDKPANPCLASRIPYGNTITEQALIRVNNCEKLLNDLGFRLVRVRDHDVLARIEVRKEEFNRIIQPDISEQIVNFFKKNGYIWVTMDIQGYRTGSMNEVL